MRDFVLGLPVVFLCSGDSRTGESTSGLLVCGCDRVLGQPNGRSLDPEAYFTATGFPTVLVRIIEGRSRVGACSVLAFPIQVRLRYNSLRCNTRLIHFAVQFFS